jgi:hypothetical protein
MKPFVSRYLPVAVFSVLLAACQSPPAQPPAATPPDAWQQLQQSIVSNELATAEDQLSALQAQPGDPERLEPLQRQLAEAYLRRSQRVLQKGDVNAAATALSRARALMPTAPALTGGVNGAIAQARKAELDKAEAALRLAESRPPAKLLDPSVAASYIPLIMTSGPQLRAQLNDIASDVANYQCDVVIQVAQPGEYRRLERLLKARVETLSPDLEWRVGRRVTRDQPTQMVLIPRPL